MQLPHSLRRGKKAHDYAPINCMPHHPWGFNRLQILARGVGHLTTTLYGDCIIAVYVYLLAGDRVGI
jgi:hypothetical protein